MRGQDQRERGQSPTRREAVAALTIASSVMSAGCASAQEPAASPALRQHFTLAFDDLVARADADPGPYYRFHNNATMSAGLYELTAGAQDGQPVHQLDEIYVVMRGRARFRAADEVSEVAPGAVIFVAAGVPHHFEEITEDLKVVVVFSKAPPAPAL